MKAVTVNNFDSFKVAIYYFQDLYVPVVTKLVHHNGYVSHSFFPRRKVSNYLPLGTGNITVFGILRRSQGHLHKNASKKQGGFNLKYLLLIPTNR